MYVSSKDAAMLCGVTKPTLLKRAREAGVASKKIGNAEKWLAADLERKLGATLPPEMKEAVAIEQEKALVATKAREILSEQEAKRRKAHFDAELAEAKATAQKQLIGAQFTQSDVDDAQRLVAGILIEELGKIPHYVFKELEDFLPKGDSREAMSRIMVKLDAWREEAAARLRLEK